MTSPTPPPSPGVLSGSARRLSHACRSICAEGTDADLVARLLAWSVRPRRTTDALRRQCRDEAAASAPPGAQLLSVIASPAAGDARAALELVEVWRRLGVRVAVVGDPAYPARLADGWPHSDGPALLAWRGSCPPDTSTVALVGARRASGYGVSIAAWLAEAAASAGARVVSGGAVGIDAAAHEAALERPGGTTVVLGCGHAIAYPRQHAREGGLFDRILEEGGTILSELLPYERPRPGQVRARNRIVAALADVVVVVEGGEHSGALLTATSAAERGRTVLAVPGDVRAPGSVAPHRLLAEGAGPCTDPGALLDVLALTSSATADTSSGTLRGAAGSAPSTLPEAVEKVLRNAWPRPVRLDDLAAATSTPVTLLLGAVSRAHAAGEIAEGVDGVRLRRAPDHAP